MIQFLRTRSRFQWFLAFVWVVMVAFLAGVDIAQGKIITAALEVIVYCVLFVGAAYFGHLYGRRN